MTIEEVLCIKTKGEVAEKSADPPAVIDEIKLYKDFFTNQELYQRIHVHVIGVRPKDPNDSNAGLKAVGLFGFPRLFSSYRSKLAPMSASVKVETFGPNTLSTDYFDIGKHSFLALPSNSLPVWDAKAFVMSKKGKENTQGVKLSVCCHKNGTLFDFELKAEDFPTMGGEYKEFVHTPEDTPAVQGIEFVYKIRITDCKDNIVTKDDVASFLADSNTLSYSEEVIPSDTDTITDNALVQCWRHKKKPKGESKAVLWFLGRNDCFMHPHVAKKLFIEQGYDIYLLNYSADGMCRKRGWVEDADFNSHNHYGTFDIYDRQVEEAIKIMNSKLKYDKTVGYAHSTGGPVLINYLMKYGDDAFDGFIFNSPFLDWSADAVGSEIAETVLEHLKAPMAFGMISYDTKMGACETPVELAETPLEYLGTEIKLSAWSAKLWSQYFFDFRSRPLYEVPMTPGFATGVTGVHNKILQLQNEKKFVTLKPFMCITSRADDTLTAAETLKRIDIIGPSRCEFELRHNAHDVFLSEEASDVDMALTLTTTWMKGNGFD